MLAKASLPSTFQKDLATLVRAYYPKPYSLDM
jgi:hypothetical protein